MKINKLLYTIPAVALLTLSSCAHFLDTPTDTRVELVTTEQLRMLMNSAYPVGNYAWPCELMSDNMEDNNAPDADGLRYNLSPYNRGDDEMFRFETCVSSSDSETPSGIWESYYNAIASANAVLERLDQMKEENGGVLDATQSAIRGEALVLRSFCHFILAQVFCEPYAGPDLSKNKLGIPYITRPEVTVKPHYDRGTLDQTYAKIQADLEDGLPLIGNTLYTVPKYHFNTSAAYAYAARFYLFTRQYVRAYNCANIAFGAARTGLDVFDPSTSVDASGFMSPIWSNLGNFYYLSDFGLYQNGIDKQHNFMVYATYSTALRHLSGGQRYGVIRNALNSTLHGASPAWSGFKWSQTDGKGGSFTMHPCFNGCSFINGKSEYGLYVGCNIQEQFEYTDKVSGIGYCHITRREFFGEETLLVRAEARLFLGDRAGALADLSVWEKVRRNCPGAAGHEDTFEDLTEANIQDFYENRVPADPESSSNASGYGISKPIHIDEICPVSDATESAASVNAMLQCIQHFRRIETLHTGMRWFDIKRLGLEYTRVVGKDAQRYHLGVHDPRKAIQIPSEVVAAGMQPNPRMDVSVENSTEKVVPVANPGLVSPR